MDKKLDWFLFALAVVVFGTVLFSVINFSPVLKTRENTALVFTQWWQDELEADALESLVREYEARTPGITVTLVHRPYGEMIGDLLSRTEAAPPDIIGLDSYGLDELIRAGLLENLGPYQTGDPDFAPPGAFPTGSSNGPSGEAGTFALPLISFMAPLFYNSALLEEAGFDRPPKTREDFLAYARALSGGPAGVYGMVLALSPENPPGVYRDIFSWIWASGTEFTAGTVPDFTEPAVKNTLDFLNRLYQEGLLSPSPFTKTEDEKRREFMSGRAAMMIGSIAEIHRLRLGNPELRFGISTIPPADTYRGRPVFGLTGWYAGISRESLHKDEAWAFLDFLNERRSFLASMAHAVPGNRDDAAGITGEDPLYAKAYDMYAAGDAVDQFVGKERETLLREQLKALFEGARPLH